MTSFSISLSWSLAYGTRPSCRDSVTNDITMPTASSGATMRANVIAGGLHRRQSRSRSRAAASPSSVPSSSAIGITSTTYARQRPQKDEKRRPQRRVFVADQLADVENLGRRKDQGKGGETEAERTGQLRQHVPVENRIAAAVIAGILRPDKTGAAIGESSTSCAEPETSMRPLFMM